MLVAAIMKEGGSQKESVKCLWLGFIDLHPIVIVIQPFSFLLSHIVCPHLLPSKGLASNLTRTTHYVIPSRLPLLKTSHRRCPRFCVLLTAICGFCPAIPIPRHCRLFPIYHVLVIILIVPGNIFSSLPFFLPRPGVGTPARMPTRLGVLCKYILEHP